MPRDPYVLGYPTGHGIPHAIDPDGQLTKTRWRSLCGREVIAQETDDGQPMAFDGYGCKQCNRPGFVGGGDLPRGRSPCPPNRGKTTVVNTAKVA
jgi:hypothetical protein